LGVDRDVVHAAVELALVDRRAVLPAQRSAHVVAARDLGHDRPQAAPYGHHPERGGDRGLPHAALADDDDELPGEDLLAQASPSQ
jgi:hypothetical protein